MIKITLPGSKNIFIINDLFNSKSIENEIFNTFYPYVTDVTPKNFNMQWDIWIERNTENIRVKRRHYGWKKLDVDVLSLFDCYKIAYSIIRENLQLDDEYCFLHGSATLIDNRLCLFLSETGMGKSTLSVYFDMHGYKCITDDLIILDKKNYTIYPISKYAHIRKEGLFLFQNNIDLLTYNRLIDRYEYLLSESRFQDEYKVEYIFILRRGYPNTALFLCNNAFECILENMFLPYQIKGNIFSSAKISCDYSIYSALCEDLDSLLKEIREFIKS